MLAKFKCIDRTMIEKLAIIKFYFCPRIYSSCSLNLVEDETHFLIERTLDYARSILKTSTIVIRISFFSTKCHQVTSLMFYLGQIFGSSIRLKRLVFGMLAR